MTAMTTNGSGGSSIDGAIIERVIAVGDLEQLRPMERAQYYTRLCESLGLNPLTQPFMYVRLNGKLQLYAKKDATDQMRSSRDVSIQIVSREVDADGVYTVTARAKMPSGRCDESTGCVYIAGKKGEDLANAKMKAETKAKRRATLSICGLGWLDETEVQDVKGARLVTVTQDGEILDTPPAKPASAPDLTKQLAASLKDGDWHAWATGHLSAMRNASTTGELLEAWLSVNDDIKAMNPPAEYIEALKAGKEELKATLKGAGK